jgi:hypothetical protein
MRKQISKNYYEIQSDKTNGRKTAQNTTDRYYH